MKALTILVVAETLTDGGRLRAALAESLLPVHLHVAHNGAEALAFLQCTDSNPSTPRPDVIVLDVTVSQDSRQEVRAALRKDPQLKPIPVVVLTAQTRQPMSAKNSERGGRSDRPQPRKGARDLSGTLKELVTLWSNSKT